MKPLIHPYSIFSKSGFNKVAFCWALLFALVLVYHFSDSLGIFVFLGLFFNGLVLFNLGAVLKGQVTIPHLMVVNYFLQHLIAAVVLYKYPPVAMYDIGSDSFPFYVSFAVPSCIALYFGVLLATKNVKGVLLKPEAVKINFPAWAFYAKHLYWVGFIALLASPYLADLTYISFIIVLVSLFSYVGLFTIILSGDNKWWLYALLLFSYGFFISVMSSFFHDLILWGGALFLVLSYRYRWRMKNVVVLFIAMILIVLLQSVKEQYRQLSQQQSNPSIATKIYLMKDLMANKIMDTSLIFDTNTLAATFVRFNQGWIVNRVMQRVPDMEPYANGTTILKGFYAAFIPRIIDPDKPIAGGRINFEKYTGLELSQETAMTIGVTGEMYANFGLYGGVIGMAVYGYLIGMLYLRLYNKALENPVWWAWGPFVGLMAMKAEEGLMETTTWIVKSMVVMFIVIFVCNKAMRRRALFPVPADR